MNVSEVNKLESVGDKDTMIGQYLKLIQEKQKLEDCHSLMQLKLSERLKRDNTITEYRDNGKSQIQQGSKEYIEELIQQFAEDLSAYAAMKHEARVTQERFRKILSEKQEECQKRRSLVYEKKNRLQELKRNAGLRVIQNNGTKHEFHKLLTNGEEKDIEIESIRLRNIRLRMAIKKLELNLKLKDKVEGALNILDFEQLKLENLTNNEKIEERNEEVLKLKSKISMCVQILAHGKEKLHFMEKMLYSNKENLANLEKALARKRYEMCRTKHARDSLRKSNDRLKVSGGILDNELLIMDYEECADNCEQMRVSLEKLKQTYLATKKRII